MDITKVINDAITNPGSIGAPILVGGTAYLIGMALKKSPVADWLIPWILLALGGVVYPFVAADGNIDPSITHPWVRESMFGVAYSGLAVFGDQLIQQFKNRGKTASGNTEFIEKPKPE